MLKSLFRPHKQDSYTQVYTEYKVTHLCNKHDDQDEDEHRVEIGDVEGGPKATNQGVSSNNSSK